MLTGVDVTDEHAGTFAREPRALAVAPVDQAVAQVALAYDRAVLVAQVHATAPVDHELHDVARVGVVSLIRTDGPNRRPRHGRLRGRRRRWRRRIRVLRRADRG